MKVMSAVSKRKNRVGQFCSGIYSPKYVFWVVERLTHVFVLVVDGQGAAGGKGEDGEAGGGSGENQLVVQIVKHNRLKDEVGI